MSHLEPHLTVPPPRRLGALALIRQGTPPGAEQRVLLVEQAHRTGPERWGLPGGWAEEGEPAPAACEREVREKTGLRVSAWRALVIHHMPAHGRSREDVTVVFDGGDVPPTTQIFLARPELASHRWADPAELRDLVAPHTAWRITRALEELTHPAPGVAYLVGHPSVPASTA
jgi:8-oxo-dGTP pyrophosphatase MutT (NUDIX family)